MPFRRLVRQAARGLAEGVRHSFVTVAVGADEAARALRGRRATSKPAGEQAGPAPRKSAKPASRPPPTKRQLKQQRKAARAEARRRTPPPFGAPDALGFFLLAGLIVAWPRERSLLQVWREEGWRGLLGPPTKGKPAPAPDAAAQAEPGRGRDARNPLAIPARGWRDILLRTWRNFNSNRIMATAGGVTFFTLLAIFPAMAAFISLYGLFLNAQDARAQLQLLAGFVPRDIIIFVGDEMSRIAAGGGGKLGFAFAVSLLLSLWSANGALKALIDGLNVAYEQKETRSFLMVNAMTLSFTAGAILFALLAIGAVVVAPAVFAFLHLDAGASWLALLRWPVLLLVLAFGLSIVYRYGPNRAHPRWRWITPGGLLAALLWLGASLLFSLYVSSFGSFNRTYGSLGAVVGFMTWIWYSTIIVLFGAELNSEIEHQTAVDTTRGRSRRAGARGAKMADTLGEAQP